MIYFDFNYSQKELVTNVAVSGVEMNAVGFLTYDAKLFQTYSVKRVVSPFEFYLEREIETKCEESLRDEKMQEFYEEEEKQAFEVTVAIFDHLIIMVRFKTIDFLKTYLVFNHSKQDEMLRLL